MNVATTDAPAVSPTAVERGFQSFDTNRAMWGVIGGYAVGVVCIYTTAWVYAISR